MQLFKKINGAGTTALIISNKEMEDVMKIVKITWRISETIKNEAKEQKAGFVSMLLGTLVTTY